MNGSILINKNNLINNLNEIKKFSPTSKIMSMIKSDAYGHGIIETAKLLKKSDAFAVATMEEAKFLRDNRIKRNSLFARFSNESECIYCSENNIKPVMHDFLKLIL